MGLGSTTDRDHVGCEFSRQSGAAPSGEMGCLVGVNNRCPVCEEPPLASCLIGQSGQGDVAAGGVGGGRVPTWGPGSQAPGQEAAREEPMMLSRVWSRGRQENCRGRLGPAGQKVPCLFQPSQARFLNQTVVWGQWHGV